MNDNYYERILTKIKKLITEAKYLEAKTILDEELRMPYIPELFESQLYDLEKELLEINRKEPNNTFVLSRNQLEKYLLHGNEVQQLQAVNDLSGRNLREYSSLIKEYLVKQPKRIIASLLILACIEQEIQEEISYNIDDLEYKFVPALLENPIESSCFKEASNFLKQWFSNEKPSFLALCMDVLIREVYLALPATFDDEAELLAVSVVANVYQLLNDQEGLDQFLNSHNYEAKKLIGLHGWLALIAWQC